MSKTKTNFSDFSKLVFVGAVGFMFIKFLINKNKSDSNQTVVAGVRG